MRVNWILTGLVGVAWLAMLITSPEDLDGLIGLGGFALVMALLSWHHSRQVSRGQTPWAISFDRLRPFLIGVSATALVVLVVLLAINLAAPQASFMGVLAVFLPPLLVGAALIYWLRK